MASDSFKSQEITKQSKNLLTLNINKTKFIAISLINYNNIKIHKYNCSHTNKRTGINTIERADNITYLGIFIGQYLKWNTHLNFINIKILKIICKCKQLKNLINVKILNLVHNSLIKKHIKLRYVYLRNNLQYSCASTDYNPEMDIECHFREKIKYSIDQLL